MALTGMNTRVNERNNRLAQLSEKGVQHITTARRADLTREWGVNPQYEIFGLRVGKKKRKKEGAG